MSENEKQTSIVLLTRLAWVQTLLDRTTEDDERGTNDDDDGFSERDDGVGKRWRHVHGGWSGVLRHQRGEDLWRCVRLRTA